MIRKIFTLLCVGAAFCFPESTKAQVMANFSSNITSGCSPILVQFTDQSTGNPTSWNWDLGNGTISTIQNPSTTYITPGTYTVTVTDSKGCSKTASVTITQPEFMLAGNCVTTGVSCNGGTDGTATAVAVGGTAPYTYTWNTVPVQTGATVSGLAAGTYMVTVADANGCTKTATCTITQPPVLLVSASKTNIVCNGAANGTATAIAGGGTPAYTYSWNTTPVQTTATATGLGAGSYIVTVTDANGCTATASVNILQPLPMTATITPNHVDCNGGSDGTASVAATGGTPLYSYSWNTVPVKTTATVTGLIAGRARRASPYRDGTVRGPRSSRWQETHSPCPS